MCGYQPVVEYINSRISSDQHFILKARDKLKTGQITDIERLRLTISLMMYRLLPINEEGRCHFYNFLCLNKPQQKPLRHVAEQYLENHPQGPRDCYIRNKGKAQKADLLSKACESAIKKRVRPIPFPLGIAQAGLESAWGSSYFAKEGYNFFGVQTTFASAKDSIHNDKCVPARRNNKKCVYKFDSVENSFFIYAQILNSSGSYIRLREQRYQAEIKGAKPCEIALKMVAGLDAYAKDKNYKNKVRNAIHQICDIAPTC